MSKVVLDSSALLAYLNGEIGGDKVLPYLGTAYLSAVNYAEVRSVLTEVGYPPEKIEATINPLIYVVEFDQAQASLAGDFRSLTKPFGLSLGDRACLALATHLKKPVLTADQIWKKLSLPFELDIQLIR